MPTPVPPDAGARPSWVAAAPFRAHLAHVVEVTRLPWPVVALHAGVSLGLAEHLLFGRLGRRVPRLPPSTAARLLAVSPASALALRTRVVDARPTVRLLGDLLAHETPARLALALDASPGYVLGVAEGRAHAVPELFALRVLAEVLLADRRAAGLTPRAA